MCYLFETKKVTEEMALKGGSRDFFLKIFLLYISNRCIHRPVWIILSTNALTSSSRQTVVFALILMAFG